MRRATPGAWNDLAAAREIKEQQQAGFFAK